VTGGVPPASYATLGMCSPPHLCGVKSRCHRCSIENPPPARKRSNSGSNGSGNSYASITSEFDSSSCQRRKLRQAVCSAELREKRHATNWRQHSSLSCGPLSIFARSTSGRSSTRFSFLAQWASRRKNSLACALMQSQSGVSGMFSRVSHNVAKPICRAGQHDSCSFKASSSTSGFS